MDSIYKRKLLPELEILRFSAGDSVFEQGEFQGKARRTRHNILLVVVAKHSRGWGEGCRHDEACHNPVPDYPRIPTTLERNDQSDFFPGRLSIHDYDISS